MRLRRHFKDFEFLEKNRSRVVLGAGTRLDPARNLLTLDGAGGTFDTSTTGFTARTWLTNPQALRRWGAFQAFVANGRDAAGAPVTGARYRLSMDGVGDLWWDGAAWATPTLSTQWNTEAEVSAHAPALLSKSLQVVINLWTADTKQAPEVTLLRFVFSSALEPQEDVVYRTLVPLLKTLRPISDYLIDLPSTGGPFTTIDLGTLPYKLETPYNVVGIDSVFDLTADPEMFFDLSWSFDTGTKVVTLSAGIPAGHRAMVRFLYQPAVNVQASQDSAQLNAVPAIVVDSISFDGNEIGARDWVSDKAAGTAVKIERPWMGDLRFDMTVLTEKQVDHQRLVDEVKRLFTNTPNITSRGLDEQYSLLLLAPQYASANVPNKADINTSRFRARVSNVLIGGREVDGYAVERLTLTSEPVS